MVEPLPTKLPIWNTGGSNRTEPLTSEKTAGWAVNDQPPSSYFNWLQYFTGAWLTWLNERVTKGTNEIDLVVSALQPDTAGPGGDLTISSGPANGVSAGGSITVSTPDSTTGQTGGITIQVGDVGSPGSGRGGDVNVGAGQGRNERGGDTYLSAGNASGGGDRDGGEVFVSAGVGIGLGAGGRVRIVAGASTTGGNAGDIELVGATGTLSGSDVSITAGNASVGQAGDISITAGSGGTGNEGGDINITAGATTDSNGGDVTITGGAVTGTNREGGAIEIKAGSSTGSAGSFATISVAEAGASGTAVRSPTVYLNANGSTGLKRLKANRHLIVENSAAVDATRGNMQLVPKVTPTTPVEGDIYADSAMHQMQFYNGTRYHNLNPLVYDLNAGDMRGRNPSPTSSGNIVFEEDPSPFGSPNGTPIRHIIPANSLRVGSQIRVKYAADHTGVGTEFTNLWLGSVGAGPSPYTSPSGLSFATNGANVWDNVHVEAIFTLAAIGGSGIIYANLKNVYSNGDEVDLGAGIRNAIATNVAIDVFVTAVMAGSYVAMDLNYFSVEVI